MRHQEDFGEAYLSAEDGVVAHTEGRLVSDLTGRSYEEAPRIFLMSRPPLLTRRGIRSNHESVHPFTRYSL